MRDNSKRNFISKRLTAFVRVRSVIFSLIKTEEIIRSLSCKNPFCAIVKGLRFSKASEEQIPTAILEETTKRVNCHENGNLPLFCIEKDTRVGVLYAPFACVLMVYPSGLEPEPSASEAEMVSSSTTGTHLCYYNIKQGVCQYETSRKNAVKMAKIAAAEQFGQESY